MRFLKVSKKVWKCPSCKRVRTFEEDLVMKVCYVCQVPMEVTDEQYRRSRVS